MSARFAPALLAIALASCAAETGGYWPQWRGPMRDNISTESNLLREWPPEGPPLLWSVEGLGTGVGTVAVAGGRVFATGFHGDFEHLTALEERTGRRLWTAPIGTNQGAVEDGVMRWLTLCTPTVDADRIYAFSRDGRITCLEAATGRTLWRKDYIEDLGGKRSPYGISDFPLVDGDRVICVVSSEMPTMMALDKNTGETVWRSPTSGEAMRPDWVCEWGATIVAEIAGVRQYIAFLRHGLYGFRATDGAVLWTYRPISRAHTGLYTRTPIVAGDCVLAPTAYTGGLAGIRLRRRDDDFVVEEMFFVSRASMQFTQDSSVTMGGRFYGLMGPGILTCIDAVTGNTAWKQAFRSVRGYASFTCVGDRLVLHSDNSADLVAIGQQGAALKGTIRLEKAGGGGTMPVITGGRLYLRRENMLLAYDLRDGRPAGIRTTAVRHVHSPLPAPPGAKLPMVRRAAFIPTPQDIVQQMLRLASLARADVVCDMGSGDGRIVTTAAQDYGARGIGYEIDPDLVRLSRKAVETLGLRDLVTIEAKDLFTADLSPVTVVAVYLPEEFLVKLKPKFATLKPGSRIVSHQFRIPGVLPDKEIEVESNEDGLSHKIYLWTTPLKEGKK